MEAYPGTDPGDKGRHPRWYPKPGRESSPPTLVGADGGANDRVVGVSSEEQPMGSRPLPALAGCVLLVCSILGGCGQSDPAGGTTLPPPSATAAPPATSSALTLPTTAASITSTTTTEPASEAAPQILVAGPDGVYLVEPGAEPVQLVSGRAATAVDDGLGGLLYQVDAGRAWHQTGEPRTTIVWWIPAGSERPLDLLVPALDQSLTLEDAAVIDGDLTVFYRRSEGDTPDEMVDILRYYDHATGTVTELMHGSVWEAGFDVGSVGGGIIAGTLCGQIESSCFFLDLDGHPFATPADPSIAECEGPSCAGSCVVSPDGSRLAHAETPFDESTNATTAHHVVVSDMATGAELHRIEIPQRGARVSLDISGDWILVNGASGDDDMSAWVIDLARPDIPAWEAPVAGVARFVTAPVTVRPSPLVLRGDGLGIVALGQPMASAIPLLEARFGLPTSEHVADDTSCEGSGYEGTATCCFAATGYGCDKLFRALTWRDLGLSVIFSDRGYRIDGVPHLTFWSFAGAQGAIATEEGITTGTSVAEVRAAYGARLVATETPCVDGVPAFRTDGEQPLHFTLDGAPDDPSTTVTSLWAGNPGSC